MPIDSTYADNDYGALAADLLQDARFDRMLSVVCWHHGNIPGLMAALGCPPGTFDDPWPAGTFDLLYEVKIGGAAAPEVEAVRTA